MHKAICFDSFMNESLIFLVSYARNPPNIRTNALSVRIVANHITSCWQLHSNNCGMIMAVSLLKETYIEIVYRYLVKNVVTNKYRLGS